jgi:hypothetical protein
MLVELKLLGDDLRRHFVEEEEGGCLEEAVSRCPSVAPQADALQGQHAALLNSLDQMIAGLSSNSPRAAADGFSSQLKRFCQDLLAHEAAENQVMRQAFGITVNGEDE